MDVVVNSLAAVLVVVVAALAIARVREQKKLGDAAENLERTHHRFNGLLDRLVVANGVHSGKESADTEFRSRPTLGENCGRAAVFYPSPVWSCTHPARDSGFLPHYFVSRTPVHYQELHKAIRGDEWSIEDADEDELTA